MKKLIFILVFSSNYIFSELPVENFYKFTEFSNLIISPSGKYFASEVDAEKTSGVVIIERASMKVIHTQSFGKDQYTAGFRFSSFVASAILIGSKESKDFGLPVLTSQNLQALVQISPIIINVACFLLQHSAIFGQFASWQTVFKLFLLIIFFVKKKF